jgi:BA14K-like protein
MFSLKHIGAAVIASVFATAIVIDTADARRGGGGGGGGMRAGGFGGGGAMRAGGLGGGSALRAGGLNRGGAVAGNRIANAGSFTRVSNPIANRPDIGRPGRPDVGLPGRPGNRPDIGLPGRPGNRPGWGGGWGGDNWPGYGWGWGAAAVGAGLAYGASTGYCDPYYSSYGCNYGYGSYAPAYGATAATYETSSDAIADCARRFRSYDPASQTYLSYGGQRVSCP